MSDEISWIQILAESFFTFNILDAFLSYKKKIITFEVELRNDLNEKNIPATDNMISNSKNTFLVVYFSFLIAFSFIFYYIYFEILPIKISLLILCLDTTFRIMNNWIPNETKDSQ
jgi:hypothetical protein